MGELLQRSTEGLRMTVQTEGGTCMIFFQHSESIQIRNVSQRQQNLHLILKLYIITQEGRRPYWIITELCFMILGTPQGICEPPKFNVEASINTDCLNCFCFGHTTQCYSSDLQISKVRRICCCKSLEFKIVDVLDKCIERFDVWLLQIDLVGELKMVNLNSSLPIDERYVEYLPTGEYGGFYQVGDGLRLVPPGIYYWSLPGEFLGERVHSRICKSLLK